MPRGPPKHARNPRPMSFLAKIVLLFFVCSQVAPRLYATLPMEHKERNLVIESDLMNINSKCYFSGDLNLVSTIDHKKPLPIARKKSNVFISCYSFQNASEKFLILELEPIRLELRNNSNMLYAASYCSSQEELCLPQHLFPNLASVNYNKYFRILKKQTPEPSRVLTQPNELSCRWRSITLHPAQPSPLLSSRYDVSTDIYVISSTISSVLMPRLCPSSPGSDETSVKGRSPEKFINLSTSTSSCELQ